MYSSKSEVLMEHIHSSFITVEWIANWIRVTIDTCLGFVTNQVKSKVHGI